jgi:hypothetical protein
VRIVRALFRFFGWLLTPLVAWAASFVGAWAGASVGRLIPGSSVALGFAVLTGAAGAIAGTLFWMRLLRRSPELREVLAVTEQGVPVAAVEDETPSAEEQS